MGNINQGESTTDAPPPKPKGKFVYQGMRVFDDGEWERWARVVDFGMNDHPVTDFYGYWKPGKRHVNVGSVYEFEYTLNEDGSDIQAITFPLNFAKALVGNWPDREEVKRWLFDNEGAIIASRMDSKAKALAKDFEKELRDIRIAYLAARTKRERAAILALVIRLVTDG